MHSAPMSLTLICLSFLKSLKVNYNCQYERLSISLNTILSTASKKNSTISFCSTLPIILQPILTSSKKNNKTVTIPIPPGKQSFLSSSIFFLVSFFFSSSLLSSTSLIYFSLFRARHGIFLTRRDRRKGSFFRTHIVCSS